MKLLVTGGAGYIGSIVSQHLLSAGHDVTVLDNLERGHREAIPEGARLVEADLRDADATRDAVAEGFDGALHFAALALVGESVANPERYWRTNVTGTLNLLDALRAADVKRLVFSSTCAVYGEPEVVPIREDTPTRPVNAYGASKLAVDVMIGNECRAHELGAVSLRYFNVAGASGHLGEDHYPETHIIPNVMRAAQGLQPEVQVFGTGYGFSVREVIAAVSEVTGLEVPVKEADRRPGDPPMLVAASEKIRDELGWVPSKPKLTDMVADAWAFAQARPRGYKG